MTGAPALRRVLGLWDLVLYGIMVIMPIAPIPLFGVAQVLSRGHAVTTILIAMCAMMLTAVSYGRMASLYPLAGSAYTYVGRGLNAHLGFLAGWAMFLDYLLIPLLCTIYGSLTIQRFLPEVPYPVLALVFAGAMTMLNLKGIRSTTRTNLLLLIAMSVVVGVFMVMAVRYLFVLQGWGGVFSSKPFYNPATFEWRSTMTATSLAALTYIGFDGVTTLAEEVKNPKRNVLIATVLVCLITGILGGMQVYLGQRVWPEFGNFPAVETAYMDITRRVGGPLLFYAMAAILIIANFGSGLSGQVGAARLLFGMGRDNVLPSRLFGHLDGKTCTPTYNIWAVGVVAFFGALLFNYEQAAETLNFGAFLAFMGVNLATLRQFYLVRQIGRRRHLVSDAILPVVGFLFCFGIWLGLKTPAKVIGGAWLTAGVAYSAIKTRGFRTVSPRIEFTDDGDLCIPTDQQK